MKMRVKSNENKGESNEKVGSLRNSYFVFLVFFFCFSPSVLQSGGVSVSCVPKRR